MPSDKNRRFGDRKEGRKLRSIDPFSKFIPHIMIEKNESSNLFKDDVEVTETERWLRAKRTDGYKGLGMLHLIIAAYVRTIALRPALNRFISGSKIFARNDIVVFMTIKRTMTSDSTETSIKVAFDPNDTVFDVYRKMNAAIDEVKADEGESGADKVAGALCKLPSVILKFVLWLVKLLDFFDLLPMALLDVSPFHGSLAVTDLGSLGIPPIYHHLYNFGNLPVFLSFGAKRREVELDKSGTPVERKYIDYTVVMDERICDGYYYSTAFKFLKYYLRNPEQLEAAPEKVEQDIF